MARSSLIRLFALAALWGGSFLFIRIAAQDIPAPLLMFARAAIAAIILFVVGGFPARDARTVKHLFIVGIMNSAIPFVLIAVAAHTLGASVCSVLNASSPAFAALIGALVARTMPSLRTAAGLAIGLIGVAITASSAIESSSTLASVDATHAILAALASIGAAVCYGIAGVYTKRATVVVSPMHTSSGSMGAAAVALALPALWSTWAAASSSSSTSSEHALGTVGEWGAVVALAVLCTAIAYTLFFRIVADEGPIGALSVTFLVPIFGVLWSALFLAEPIGARVVVGCAVVLLGTFLTTGIGAKPAVAR